MSVLVIIRWVATILLCGCAGLLLVVNWGALFASLWYRWQGQDKYSSMIPLVGPFLGTLGLLICPADVGWYAAAYWVLEPAIVLSPLAWISGAYRWVRRALI